MITGLLYLSGGSIKYVILEGSMQLLAIASPTTA
jgi:hypothetical protein